MSIRGLDIALSGLAAQQQAIDVLNHNIANANTPGFSRQRLNLEATPPYMIPTSSGSVQRLQAGSGVQAGSINRMRDAFLDKQVRNETLRSESAGIRQDTFDKLQTIFSEPSDTGISAQLSAFWNSWQDLSANPSDTASRSAVLQQAMALTNQLNSDSSSLGAQRRELSSLASQQATDINDIAKQLATLNSEIQRSELGGAKANDLLDRRDILLDQMAGLVDAQVITQPDDTVTVFLDGQDLVNRTTARAITTSVDAASLLHVSWTDTGEEMHPSGGKLQGTVLSSNTDVVNRATALDQLALQLRDDVNALHRTGFDRNGATGADFFSGAGAGNLRVDAAIQTDVRRIAAAGQPNAAGDASVALAIAQLAHTVSELGGASLASGAALTTSGATVQRVVVNGAQPSAAYTLSSTAPGKLTISTIVAGQPINQTIDIGDMAANANQTLEFTGIGITIAVQSGGSGATAADLVADLTAAGANTVTVGTRVPVEDGYQSLVVQLGIDARAAQNDKTNADALLNNLQQRRLSVSGVSLDEESANLIKYLRAYQASARVITVMDEMLQTIINNTGLR